MIENLLAATHILVIKHNLGALYFNVVLLNTCWLFYRFYFTDFNFNFTDFIFIL